MDAVRKVQLAIECGSVAVVAAAFGYARDCANKTRGRTDFTNRTIAIVRYVHVAGAVHRHARRGVQFGNGGRVAISQETGGSVAGDGVDRPASDLPDAVVGLVANIKVVVAIHKDAIRGVEFRAGSWAAIPAESAVPRCYTRENGDCVRGVDLPHDAVGLIGDVDVTVAIAGNPADLSEFGAGGRATFAAESAGARDGACGGGPGEYVHQSGGLYQFANHAVLLVRNEDVARRILQDISHTVEHYTLRGNATHQSGKGGASVARGRADIAAEGELADALVAV